MKPKFFTAGDTALLMQFGDEIKPELNEQVKAVYDSLKKTPIDGIIECVPTFRSILIYYLPNLVSYENLVSSLSNIDVNVINTKKTKRIIHIPVAYGGVYGEDIGNVANHTKLSKDEIIELHQSVPYLIYMLGFLPGFPYLGGMDKRLTTPRLKNPRTKIPRGSVGIGGEQTGIYPLESPGGWQIIGRTPIKPYDPTRKEPFLYSAGDYIKFDSVSFDEYKDIEKALLKDAYQCLCEVI